MATAALSRGGTAVVESLRGWLSPQVGVIVALVAIGLAVPALGGAGIVPLLTGLLSVLIFTYAWHPVGGILGEISVAHVAFWGAGSYAVVLGINAGFNVFLMLAVGAAVAAVLAIAVVEFVSAARLQGLYVMVFTLVFLYLVTAVVRSLEWLGGSPGQAATALPLSIEEVYFLSVIYVGVLMLVNLWLLNRRRGLVWLAIRDNAERISSLGWSIQAERRVAYLLTGVLCAVGGGLAAVTIGFVNPAVSLGLQLILVPLLAVYVGGPGTVWGPLLGVALLETLSAVAVANSTSVDTAQYVRLTQFLIALVIIMVLLRRQRSQQQRALHATPPADPQTRSVDRAEPGRLRRATAVLGRLSQRREIPGDASSAAAASGEGQTSGPLRGEDVHKAFAGLQVLTGVSFTVSRGEVVGLVGPNGAGKSTLCNIIAGTLPADAGTVRLGARTVDALRPHQRAILGLGRTYQTPHAFPSLTLAENVCIAGTSTGTAQARQLLERFGARRPDKSAATASLLERRIVEIAQLAALRPSWVLLDEPLAGLSADEHERLLGVIRELAQGGASVLLIEHLIPVIAPACDRIMVLDRGRLIADGPPREVLVEPAVVDAYLGAPMALGK